MTATSTTETAREVGSARRPPARLMSAAVILVQALVSGTNLAIPSLAGSALHPSSTAVIWMVETYVLVFAALLLPAGAIGDRYGRKRMLLVGLTLFAAGLLGAGLAPTVAVMLVARAVSGAGAALVMPATLAISTAGVPPAQRGRAIGNWSAATGIGGLTGNVAAGVILQFADWRWLYIVPVPFAIMLGLLIARRATSVAPHATPIDVGGSALLIVVLGALFFGLTEGRSLGWRGAPTIGAFVLAVLAALAFVAFELRVREPLLDPRLFRLHGLRAGSAGVAVAFTGMFTLFFINAQYLQYVKGFSPLLTGIAILPQGYVMKTVSPRANALAGRIGRLRTIALGLACIVVGLVLLGTAGRGTPYPIYLVALIVMASGMGLSTPVLSSEVLASLPKARAGVGSALNSCSREVGSALGVAIAGTILIGSVASQQALAGTGAGSYGSAITGAATAAVHDRLVTALTGGIHEAYFVIAAIVLVTAIPVLWWTRRAESAAAAAAAGTGGDS